MDFTNEDDIKTMTEEQTRLTNELCDELTNVVVNYAKNNEVLLSTIAIACDALAISLHSFLSDITQGNFGPQDLVNVTLQAAKVADRPFETLKDNKQEITAFSSRMGSEMLKQLNEAGLSKINVPDVGKA